MSRERWGTFSVADHKRDQAFVADVLLYDRLIIPVPYPGAEQEWINAQWKPERLKNLVDILGDKHAIPVTWGPHQHATFKTRMATVKGVKDDLAYGMTRMLLAQDFKPDLPEGVTEAPAIPAYTSYGTFVEDFALDRYTDGKPVTPDKLGWLLAYEFLTPEADGQSDEDLLKRAVELADKKSFQDKRAEFYAWQEDVVERKILDNKAIEEMEKLLEEYNKQVEKAKWGLARRWGYVLFGVGAGVATALLAPHLSPLAFASPVVSTVSLVDFYRKPEIKAGKSAPAAMLHDVQQHFHIH